MCFAERPAVVGTGESRGLEGDPVQRAAEIFQAHGDFIRLVIRFQADRRSEEEDLFQQFFLEMIRRPIPANVANIRSYLYRAVVHHILNSARARKARRRAVKKYAKKSRISINICPVGNAFLDETQEKGSAFAWVVRRLQRRHAKALLLRYRDNYTVGQIAASMGVNARTVSRYLSDGIRELRKPVG